ncbi:hypothetical protein ACFZBU_47795 [Embleya sp. NPDC008237]|uniref:hypothetical protein n=1 Tax=Embleya sp. NPDC008237 TaxID=3363978 RepID=UPI0036E8EF9D
MTQGLPWGEVPRVVWRRPAHPYETSTGVLRAAPRSGVVVDTAAVIDVVDGRTLWTLPYPREMDTAPESVTGWSGTRVAVLDDVGRIVVCRPRGGGVAVSVFALRTGRRLGGVSRSRVPLHVWHAWLCQDDGLERDVWDLDHRVGLDWKGDRLLWEAFSYGVAGRPGVAVPARSDEVVVARYGTDGPNAWAWAVGLDRRDGRQVWTTFADPHWFHLATMDEQVVLFRPWPPMGLGARDGYGPGAPGAGRVDKGGVRVLDRCTGAVVWEHHWSVPRASRTWPVTALRDGPGCAPVAAAAGVVVAGEEGAWVGRAVGDGRVVWRTSDDLGRPGGLGLGYQRRFGDWVCFPASLEGSLLVHAPTGHLVRLRASVEAVVGDRAFLLDGQVVCVELPTT